jgi:hypothetical protein
MQGHKMRHTVWSSLKKLKGLVQGCGAGAGRPVGNKTECLEKFRFSIIIENDKDRGYYFSEKLADSLLLATVPIQWGSGHYLKDIFDLNGFIFWQTPEDLHKILLKLDTPEKQQQEYNLRLPAIRCNYQRSLQHTIHLYDRLITHLISPEGYPNCNFCP